MEVHVFLMSLMCFIFGTNLLSDADLQSVYLPYCQVVMKDAVEESWVMIPDQLFDA